MRTSLLSFISLFSGTALMAQCTGTIPSNATVITSSTAGAVTGSGQTFWVCGTAFQQIFTGSNNQIFIESGAFVSVNGNGNTVRYKGALPLGVFGSNNTIFASSTGAVSNQGSGNTVTACGAGNVVFNYGSAPANGCSSVGIEEEALSAVRVYLDATRDVLVLDAPNTRVLQVRVLDMNGREVALSRQGSNLIELAGVAHGSYVVHLVTDHGTTIRRFVK